jgi:hypothetical protein
VRPRGLAGTLARVVDLQRIEAETVAYFRPVDESSRGGCCTSLLSCDSSGSPLTLKQRRLLKAVQTLGRLGSSSSSTGCGNLPCQD